jgi:hypothetical protein
MLLGMRLIANSHRISQAPHANAVDIDLAVVGFVLRVFEVL